jgi:hypothetical protein
LTKGQSLILNNVFVVKRNEFRRLPAWLLSYHLWDWILSLIHIILSCILFHWIPIVVLRTNHVVQ